MKKQYILLTFLITTQLSHSAYTPLLEPPSQQSLMLIPPQITNPPTLTAATPHPSPSSTPGAMTAFLTDKNVPMSAKNIAINGASGSGAGIALSGQTTKIRPGQNYQVPQAVHAATNGAMASWTQNHREAITVDNLFDNPKLAQAYQNFIDAVHEVPSFLPMFRKLHIVALHQIYLHLVGIYITLNMSSITDIKSYLALEKQFGLNKKTLIINQLVKIIQSQLTQAILSLLPNIPVSYCIKTGMTVLGRDNLSNPEALVLDLEESVLTAIGAAPISNTDAIDLYSALTSNESVALIERNKEIDIPALEEGLQIIYQGGGFVKNLIKNPPAAQAVINAINTVLGEQLLNKSNANYQQIINGIESGSMQGISEQQMELLQQTLKTIFLGIPIQQEIMAAEQFGRMLAENDPRPLSPPAFNFLMGIISFILQYYEQQTSVMLTAILNKLEVLNPSFQTLSPLQKIQLKQAAEQLVPFQKQTPLALDALQEPDRKIIATGLIMLSSLTNTNFSKQEKQILFSVGEELKKGPLSYADLSTTQVRTIKKAFLIFRAYQFQPVTQEEMLTQFSQEELEELSQLCNFISSPKFKGFDSFTTPEQILLLRMYEQLVAVVQTRLYEHQEASRTLQNIFANNPALKKQLFKSITTNQYVMLYEIDQALKTNREQFSFSMLPDTTTPAQPGDTADNPPISPKDALAQMFFVNNNVNNNPSYLSILYQLRQQNNNNPTLQAIINQIPPEEQEQYRLITEKVFSSNFSFSSLTMTQRRMLMSNFQKIRQTIVTQPIMQEASSALLAGTPWARLQTIGTLIENSMNFHQTKTSFLWVLKQYLIFFNLYCSTLQNYQSNGYKGLTKFEEYAQAITEKLKGTEIEKLNPPIFFYNKETLDGINMLPQLAQLVEKTDIVPYPTFPVLLAFQGSTIDPLDGKTYTNQVNYGTFSFNKYFFIDTTQNNTPTIGADPQAYQPAQELTGQDALSIQWVKKLTIPASTKTTSYVVQNEQGEQQEVKVQPYNFAFFPDNVPPGISGFYMNIPIFTKSPTNPRQALIRLYEQPIYAQPYWLNFPGFSQNKPDNIPGVITMLRGCLGDFTSLLDLNIFDPCLNVIFASALALPDRETSFQDLQSNDRIQQAMNKCSLYIKSKQAELQRMSQIHQVNSSAISGQANAGGTGPLPMSASPQGLPFSTGLSMSLPTGGASS